MRSKGEHSPARGCVTRSCVTDGLGRRATERLTVYRQLMTYQRGWASTSSVLGGVPGEAVLVEHTFATGPVHALEARTHLALCDPTLPIVDSTIREGWPPALGEVCPDCQAAARDPE